MWFTPRVSFAWIYHRFLTRFWQRICQEIVICDVSFETSSMDLELFCRENITVCPRRWRFRRGVYREQVERVSDAPDSPGTARWWRVRIFAWQMKAISGRFNEGGIDSDNIKRGISRETRSTKRSNLPAPLGSVPFQNIPSIAVDRNWFPARTW